MDFEMETERVCEEIRKRDAKTVVLQLPAGLKTRFARLASEISAETDALPVLAADPCYGACDTPHRSFAGMDVDLFVLYGHAPLRPEDDGGGEGGGGGGGGGGVGEEELGDTLYVPCVVKTESLLEDAGVKDAKELGNLWAGSLRANIMGLLDAEGSKAGGDGGSEAGGTGGRAGGTGGRAGGTGGNAGGAGEGAGGKKRLGLLTTVQYRPFMKLLSFVVEALGLEPVMAPPTSRCNFAGQVLGCSFECAATGAENVDAYLFLGEGDFHPLGVYLATRRRVFTLNPYDGAVSQFSSEDEKSRLFLKQRLSAVSRALDAEKWGIILSLKPGQRREVHARAARKDIAKAGRRGHIVALTEITPAVLDHMGFQAFVNTACPRITYDDFARYKYPLLTPYELEVVLSGMSLADFFDEYRFDSL